MAGQGNVGRDEEAIRGLYRDLLEAWNQRNAAAFARLFASEATVVGFDGSLMFGPDEIRQSLAAIFADHVTASYVGIVRETRLLSEDVGLLRAAAGMVPRGQDDISPATNAIQTLIAERSGSGWRIVLYQNTPAQFHGRPELVEKMTGELRAALRESRRAA